MHINYILICMEVHLKNDQIYFILMPNFVSTCGYVYQITWLLIILSRSHCSKDLS